MEGARVVANVTSPVVEHDDWDALK